MITVRFRMLAAAAVLALGGGLAAAAGTANAAEQVVSAPLSVTLSASGTGASAHLDNAGNPVLTPGSETSTTYAQMSVNLPSGATAPAQEPTFTTSNFSAGSPRWVLAFANGDEMMNNQASGTVQGKPGDAMWSTNTGSGWSNTLRTYSGALSVVDASGTVKVDKAYVVADGDQASGTHDVLTGVQYNDQALAPSATGFVKNAHSGKCLDVTGGGYVNGGELQQWACGAKNPSGVAGGDQEFQITETADGTQYLTAVAGGQVFYVTAVAQGSQLKLEAGASPAAVLDKSGPYYEIGGSLVMDVAGASTANGGHVISWPLNSQSNQQWSLP